METHNLDEGGTSNHMAHIGAIISCIHNFIQEERNRNFSFLGNYSHTFMRQDELLVVSSANTEILRGLEHRAALSTDAVRRVWVTISELLAQSAPARIVAIDIEIGASNAIDMDHLTIVGPWESNVDKKRKSAISWFRDTYNGKDNWEMQFIETRLKEQRLWWAANGKTFRLLELPPEIRNTIFLQAIGPTVVPEIVMDTSIFNRLVLGVGLVQKVKSRVPSTRDPNIDATNMAISLVSKNVRHETINVACRDTIKRLRAVGADSYPPEYGTTPKPNIPLSFTNLLSLAPHPMFLRRIELEFSGKSFFNFISIDPRQGRPFQVYRQPSVPHISALYSFPGLQTLNFWFIGPKHPDAIDPWGNVDRTTPAIQSCQKVWIEWFFVLAWPHLKALQKLNNVKITLGGCVKNSTRVRWERILAESDTKHWQAIRAMDREMRQQKSYDGPVPCRCSNPCNEVEGQTLFDFDDYEVRRIEGLQEEIDKEYWDFED